MASVKTAISLQKSLFKQVDDWAQELQVSRSRLFALAVEEFIQRRENRKVFEALNAVYDDAPDLEEQTLRDKMRQQHKQLVEGQW